MLPVLESGEETLIGGQAVMEGVMMRAPHSYCVAVRKPNGELTTEEHPVHRMSEKYPIFRWPVLRGLGTLGQAMTLGVKALKFSANAALGEGEQPVEISSWMMSVSLVANLAFFIFLYKFVPLFLATRLGKVFPEFSGRTASNFVDGGIRIVIFLTFLFLLSRMKDIRRVFEYHGAEHKVVFNYESKQPVTVENAQKFQTFHPRCGTNFLAVVLGMSFLLYPLLPVDGFLPRLALRIALLPVIAGVSYEIIRFAARRQGSLMGVISKPGLWLQRITTQPPDNTQAAVAIHALEGAMALEEKQGGELVIA
ncbi:MAG TPA: DUF1385 domain-containing protein [Bryobacteraceae bacterium]|nr:DUF1385 domain-containing protein [Bryobacteraceae bacterium]